MSLKHFLFNPFPTSTPEARLSWEPHEKPRRGAINKADMTTMISPINEAEQRRLVLIKRFLSSAEFSSNSGYPDFIDALCRVHDVLETFIILLARKQNVKEPTSQSLIEYWTLIKMSDGSPLLSKETMRLIIRARVDWKHYGLEPSQKVVQEAGQNIKTFIRELCFDQFGLHLEDISLTSIIPKESSTRECLEASEKAWKISDKVKALELLAHSFLVTLLDFNGAWKDDATGKSTAGIVESNDIVHVNSYDSGPLSRPIKGLQKAIRDLEKEVILIGVGVDRIELLRFRSIVPKGYIQGGHWVRSIGYADPVEVLDSDYRFCLDFVIRTYLRLYPEPI